MKETLMARRQQAEDTFNNLVKQKEAKQKEVDDLDIEMARLQGEWRLLGELIDAEKPKKAKVTKASEIDVTDVEGA